ncbi:Choline dehydrogenase [Frankineae bacterium MT45]|nr:Choline dehydrogenase [Frankineae bacterium MT45]
MLDDANSLSSGTQLRSEVCVVGAGVAGIAIARELAKAGQQVLLVESGDLKRSAATDALSMGSSAGDRYEFAHYHRSRFFGGSSNCWAGYCRPLEPEDFAVRPWIPNSGWPIGYADLLPYYQRTHEYLGLGPWDYSSEFWETSIQHPQVRRAPLDETGLRDSFNQFAYEPKLGVHHRSEVASNPRVQVLLNANLTEIETTPDGGQVTGLVLRTLSGRQVRAQARRYVLATGGIENARLLLASARTRPEGIGNRNDLVGRYFMDHPRVIVGRVSLRDGYRHNLLYDVRHQNRSSIVAAHGTSVAAAFVLSPEVLAREELLSARTSFWTNLVGEGTQGQEALARFYRVRRDTRSVSRADLRELSQILRSTEAAAFAGSRLIPTSRRRVRETRLEIVAEQAPDPRNRVTLSAVRDALGVPRAHVDWEVSEAAERTLRRTAALVAEALARAGVADIDGLEESDWTRALSGTVHHVHHMGTTRMHESPELGVVDRDCRVHGVQNLFIAGSSVFPTGGSNFPTMTIAALALRLADHLARLDAPVVVPAPNA